MKKKLIKYIFLIFAVLNFSCKKFTEINPPVSYLGQETLFQNDDLAISAIGGIYSRMSSTQEVNSINHLCGLSADELTNYNSGPGVAAFYDNQLTDLNTSNNTLFLDNYAYIYTANSIIEGLEKSNNLTPAVKLQLQGEAHFIRAFCYFYLVNLYGSIPVQVITDYKENRTLPRSSIDKVYRQIVADLKIAEVSLTDKYVTTERVRPNLGAAQALMARTYLFLQDWTNAEKYATAVIDKGNIYSLVDLENVFLKNSSEAVWQLVPPVNTNTTEGQFFILTTSPTNVAVDNRLINDAFELGDKRKSNWLKSLTIATTTYYYPFKYKIRSSTTITEYSTVLRLAELYLIRSEARAQLNNLAGSIDDIDKLRNRAGVTLVKNTNATITKTDLLDLILKERRAELFTEWGHRWLDLKRTNRANVVLGAIKSTWLSTDLLYPIPYDEMSRNPNMIQNPGY
ncbi:RagB/SusD domain-containing protein [Pedobacter westerhofensis]|uniref:RagB/SusD domain-containing protein n=1 Tax=Pedobacter westerhofensis TaxID=425512 RepID=A0A521EB62_9SPHI|nr:RagB/SusD family nutrient uptake outer membrane protein [Pedobacter westerhofensis]SMO81022.1 RagB/SusD domain-containing protein [Pedobacter westerhofensis]